MQHRSKLGQDCCLHSVLPSQLDDVFYVDTIYVKAPLGSVLSVQCCNNLESLERQVRRVGNDKQGEHTLQKNNASGQQGGVTPQRMIHHHRKRWQSTTSVGKKGMIYLIRSMSAGCNKSCKIISRLHSTFHTCLWTGYGNRIKTSQQSQYPLHGPKK